MIKLACCIPGGSLMPEGVAEVPKSPAENIIEKCRYVLSLGYDFTECGGGMLAGLNEEELKLLADENKRESLRIAAVNSLFPGRWRLSDPRVDKTEYLEYAEKLFSVMELLGVPYAVFGSGSARTIPDDVDFDDGADELYGFLLSLAEKAKKHGITLLIEPLRSTESNIFTTVEECGHFVREVDRDNIKLLFDSFHMAEEKSSVKCVRGNFDIVRHCHISESPKRTIPGSTDSADLEYNKAFINELKNGGYNGVLSVESSFSDFYTDAAKALDYLKKLI